MNQAWWILSVVLAFAAGWWLGRQAESVLQDPPPLVSVAGERPLAVAAAPSLEKPSHDLAGRDWEELLDELDDLARESGPDAAAGLRSVLLEQAQTWAGAGQQDRAEALLEAYIARNPHDLEARLLLSEVLQMQGLLVPAMAPVLAALQVADEPSMVARLRDALRLLVNVHESQLAARGNVPALIRFFEELTLEDPSFDGHRLALARWLLLGGRYDEADAVVAQMGLVGVTPEAHSDLEAEIRLARSGLPVRWEDNAMHVEVSASGRAVQLLVDTGASTTAVSRAAADALGSEATGRKVQVRTAGGTIVAEVHRIPDFQVGALRLPSLEVLVMEQGPPGAEGLLGMDILGRFRGASGASGLLGTPAPSG